MKILDLKDSHRYNLQFDVDGQFVKRTDNNLPVAKCKNLFKAKFNFIGDEWTGTKTALFAQGEYSKSVVLDDNDECVIPWEFFDTDENMAIGKVSVSCGDLVTTNCATVKITKSGYQESDASVPPSPDVYQQLIELAEDTKKIAQSVRDDADAGKFDGEEGYSPKVLLTEELDGVTVTVQNKDGQQSAKVKNGKDGKDYEHSEEFTKLAEQVRQDKESVEQTVQGFENTVQQAEQSINTAKTQAVETVNATKSNAIKAVQTEGTKQVEAVQAKGQEVINSIPSDYTTQMQSKIDKQQGAENAGKALVIGDDGNVVAGEPTQQIEVDKTLTQEGQAADAKATGDKILQYAIKVTASGESIVLTDSAEEKLLDFTMQGKTEQTTTTGKNLFDVSKSQPGYYQGAQGNLVEYDENFSVSDFIQISDAQNKLCISPLSESTASFVVIFNENKEKIYSDNNSSIASRKGVIDIPTGAKYIRFSSRGIENVQAEYSDTPTDYEPYTGGKPSPSVEYRQEITSAGKLNADTGKYEVNVQVSSGNIFDVDAVRNENGYLNSDSQTALDTNRFDIVEGRQYLLISKGSTLTDGTGYSSPYFGEDNLNYANNHLDILGKEPGYQMFTKNERRKVILKAKKSTTITKFIVHGYNRVNDAYEVEEMGLFETSNNNTNIDYVAYKGLQKAQFQLDRPFTKWDRIEKRDCIWGVVYKSNEVVFDGSESWKIHFKKDKEKTQAFGIAISDLSSKQLNVMSDKFIYIKDGFIADEPCIASYGGTDIWVNIEKSKASTVEEFKLWLSQNAVTALYETDSEEFVPLPQETQTALNNLRTYYPTTVITNSEDCEMEVEYVADTKNYIDNKISANVASIISQYRTNVANLLSLMPLETQATMIENDTNNILENVEEMKHE